MAQGFEVRDSSGNIQLDTTSIGIQAIHQVTLTADSTDVTWVSPYAPFHFSYFSMGAGGFPQNLTWSNVTPAGAPVNSYTYRFVVVRSKPLENTRLIVMGGDAYTVTSTSSGIS